MTGLMNLKESEMKWSTRDILPTFTGRIEENNEKPCSR
jgi:hypothetical protein